MDVPLWNIGSHVYVNAPLAVRVIESPLQTAVGLLEALMVGNGTTMMLIVADPEHPLLLLVTV